MNRQTIYRHKNLLNMPYKIWVGLLSFSKLYPFQHIQIIIELNHTFAKFMILEITDNTLQYTHCSYISNSIRLKRLPNINKLQLSDLCQSLGIELCVCCSHETEYTPWCLGWFEKAIEYHSMDSNCVTFANEMLSILYRIDNFKRFSYTLPIIYFISISIKD